MLVGIVGAPNKGKSTLFSALTMIDVKIADYPFTTIKPNVGTTYVTKECVDRELSVRCNARNSTCADGTRMIPVEVIDVAGLVEGAHQGRGMGNQFLNDISSADALIVVVDASGRTDTAGNPCGDCDPSADVEMVENELSEWLSGIVSKHMPALSRSKDAVEALSGVLTGLRISKGVIEKSISDCGLTPSNINWTADDSRRFSAALLRRAKPVLVAANKADIPGSEGKIDRLRARFGSKNVIPCSAAVELAMRKAQKQGIIEYDAAKGTASVVRQDITDEQKIALKYMMEFVREHGTGIQQMINRIYFDILQNIVVYPVEDENKYTDHFGNVLPDAILLPRGSTAHDLAAAIHTDLAERMLYAVDARTKKRLAKDYVLKDNDVVKIVSAAKPK